jgi:DNA-binding MarR family transcriptional regulator
MDKIKKQELIYKISNFYILIQKEFLNLIIYNNINELSPIQSRMLHAIHLEGKTTPSVLSERLAISIQNTSRAIRKLNELGYVYKKKDESDNRIVNLLLSQKGLELIQKSFEKTDKKMFNKLEELTPEEFNEFLYSINKINNLLIKMKDKND